VAALPDPQLSGDVQNAHRRAAIGTALRHSGHFFVVGSLGASPRAAAAISAFIGATTKKSDGGGHSRNDDTGVQENRRSETATR
jgi:hypothetical protein